MGNEKFLLLGRTLGLAIFIVTIAACASNTPPSEPPQPNPTATQSPATVTPTEPNPLQVSTTLDLADDRLQPYPFTTPLPPPTPTLLDGIYTRVVQFEGTPTPPCRRCAPYRAEGGVWTLKLDAGVFRVSHSGTDFQGVGSFTVSGDQLTLFNDPNCHLETGIYKWEVDSRSLILDAVDDTCAFDLRAKNMDAGVWLKQVDDQGQPIDRCQPPSLEAAISGHWPTPEGCGGD